MKTVSFGVKVVVGHGDCAPEVRRNAAMMPLASLSRTRVRELPARPRGPVLKPRKKPGTIPLRRDGADDLEGAARVLEERGLDGYTTNAVAERAGVSIGSVYQYFPSKEALTAALVARETGLLIDAVHAAPRAATPEEGIRLIVRAGVTHQMARPRLALLLDREESRLQLADSLAAVAEDVRAALWSCCMPLKLLCPLIRDCRGRPLRPRAGHGRCRRRAWRAGRCEALERRVLRAVLRLSRRAAGGDMNLHRSRDNRRCARPPSESPSP